MISADLLGFLINNRSVETHPLPGVVTCPTNTSGGVIRGKITIIGSVPLNNSVHRSQYRAAGAGNIIFVEPGMFFECCLITNNNYQLACVSCQTVTKQCLGLQPNSEQILRLKTLSGAVTENKSANRVRKANPKLYYGTEALGSLGTEAPSALAAQCILGFASENFWAGEAHSCQLFRIGTRNIKPHPLI